MATRIENILIRARDTLADALKERWSDERLLRILDEGHKDFAQHTGILKDTIIIGMVVGQQKYTLPDHIHLITRAAFNDCQIHLVSYDRMDEQAKKEVLSDYNQTNQHTYNDNRSTYNYGQICWETQEGREVQYLIYDRRNMNEIRVYPIPNEEIADFKYTFENDDSPIDFVGDEVMGVVTAIDNYTFDTELGIVTSMYDPAVDQEVLTPVYGVVTQILESTAELKLWFIKTPDTIDSVDDDLVTPTMFDTALKHYVVGNAFLDDLDTGYQERGDKALAMYSRELELGDDTVAADGTQATQYRTTYRNAFE